MFHKLLLIFYKKTKFYAAKIWKKNELTKFYT